MENENLSGSATQLLGSPGFRTGFGNQSFVRKSSNKAENEVGCVCVCVCVCMCVCVSSGRRRNRRKFLDTASVFFKKKKTHLETFPLAHSPSIFLNKQPHTTEHARRCVQSASPSLIWFPISGGRAIVILQMGQQGLARV